MLTSHPRPRNRPSPPVIQSPWGEHEIDYILFYVVPTKSSITLNPHPEEVDGTRWVSKSQLLDMFSDSSLLCSPWFRIIAQRWLVNEGGWWDDLGETMRAGSRHDDFGTVHRFDPPPEHMGGGGDAGPFLSLGVEEMKGEGMGGGADRNGGEAKTAVTAAGDSS